jgi:TonB family protein
MSNALNYFLEANIALCLLLVTYILILKNETSFRVARMILLGGIGVSLIFPAIHVNGAALNIPSLGQVMATVMLPEIVVMGYRETAARGTDVFSFLALLKYLYLAGAFAALIIFGYRISRLLQMIHKAKPVRRGSLFVSESDMTNAPFSFFSFIFIGKANDLTEKEKEQIIAHEAVHARQFHSLDILFLNILGIIFWFNPALRIFKNIFVQLHEYEADARSVKDEEMNDYCSLLARVALLSADIRIANHFSSSLTLKRIQMMRTIKSKIRPWKVAALLMLLPAFFVLLSCQDQVMSDVTDLAKSSTVALDVPAAVQQQYDKMKESHPEKEFLLVEVDGDGQAKVASLKEKMSQLPPETISSVNVIRHPGTSAEPERNFIIVEYTDELKVVQENSKTEDVYTMVDETAMPADGLEKYYASLANNLTYPKSAREKGLEGKVFVSFIIETDGTLSDMKVVKGVSEELDTEAVRVIGIAGNWTPGKNEGTAVRQRMVLPINFSLGEKSETKNSRLQTN